MKKNKKDIIYNYNIYYENDELKTNKNIIF